MVAIVNEVEAALAGIELVPVERAMVFIVLLRRALRAMLADKNSSQLTN